jgi:hypothetical protein
MSGLENILRAMVPSLDEAFGILATVVTGLFENRADSDAAKLGLAIAKRALEQETDPKAYLTSLLDQAELNAQDRARARFGG